MGLLQTAKTVAGAGLCAVAHGLMVAGVALAGGVPDEEEGDAISPAHAFEHTPRSLEMLEAGMPRREARTVSGGSMAPAIARRR